MGCGPSAHQNRKGDADREPHGQPDKQDFGFGGHQTEHHCDSRFPFRARPALRSMGARPDRPQALR